VDQARLMKNCPGNSSIRYTYQLKNNIKIIYLLKLAAEMRTVLRNLPAS
jgi:hypothetical protein